VGVHNSLCFYGYRASCGADEGIECVERDGTRAAQGRLSAARDCVSAVDVSFAFRAEREKLWWVALDVAGMAWLGNHSCRGGRGNAVVGSS